MPTRIAEAVWKGNLKNGEGTINFGSGAFEGSYSFASRFENGDGTNPEGLIAAAHAGCYSMALSAGLSNAGHTPESVDTVARVTIESAGNGFTIMRIDLETEAVVPGLDEPEFQKFAQDAKVNCPVSKALASVPEINLNAKLIA